MSIRQTAYRAASIECWSAVECGPNLTTAHVVNRVKLLRNSILLVTFHHIVFVYGHYSSYSHRSGLETANLYFISPPTFLFNATPSAIAVTKILLHYGRWFPAYFISSIYTENQTWVNKFLGFYLSIYLSIFLYVLIPEGDIRRVPVNQVLGVSFFFFFFFIVSYCAMLVVSERSQCLPYNAERQAR